MIRINIALFFSTALTLALSCSPKPPPVQSVKEMRSDEVKKALPAPASQRTMVATPTKPDSDAEGTPKTDGPKTGVPKTEKAKTLQEQVYNQILARGAESTDVDALTQRIEKATGAKVEKIRKGALGLLQIRFEEVNPPRDEAAQKELVAKLKDMGGLKSVEPERLMFPRGNAPAK